MGQQISRIGPADPSGSAGLFFWAVGSRAFAADSPGKKNPAYRGVICRLLVWRSVLIFVRYNVVSDGLSPHSGPTLY